VKKKLAFVVNVDWFFISHRLPIALKALEAGYEVHLLCGITHHADYLKRLGLIVHPFPFSRSGKNIVKELSCFFTLYRRIKSIKPDLMHLVTIKPVLYGGIIARIAAVPAVVSAISGLGFLFVEREGRKVRLFRDVVLFLYRFAMGHPNQRVIFQNLTDMNALVSTGSVQKDKTKIIRGSGVNLQDYSMVAEPEGTPVIIMASRLLKDKGVHEFVAAARVIKEKGINARFQLVGEPDPENPESITEETLQTWQTEGVVECLGYRSDIAKLFAQAHIVVLPSYYREGLPKVLIEAAACGLAVITTDMPGCRDAIEPDVSGVLVPARDVMALAEAMDDLLSNDVRRRQMGYAGRDLAEREFSIEKVVATHLDIYRELMDE